MRAGLLAGLLCLPLNALLYLSIGREAGEVFLGSSLLGIGGLAVIGAVVGRMHDLTEQMKQELTLRKSAEATSNIFSRAVEQSPALIVITDTEGLIEYVNPRLKLLTHLEREEVIGKPVWSIGSLSAEERTIMRKTLTSGAEWHGEMENRRKDGETNWLSTFISPVKSTEGRITHYVGIHEDITERRRAAEEVRRLNEELEQRVRDRTHELEAANKELDSFSYSVSHDLRAPLRAMDGFSRILMEDYGSELSEEGQGYLKRVRDNAKQMGQLVDDLLAFSRLGSTEMRMQPIVLTDLVERALTELTGEGNAEVSIGDLPECYGDPALLKHVYINLLSNALKFTSKQENAKIEVGFEKLNGEGTYFIKDNGAGFDMKYADKLFGVFQRLHFPEDYKGTGVGLAIAKRVIQRHGGRIWAEAKVAKGATFFFTLGGNSGHD